MRMANNDSNQDSSYREDETSFLSSTGLFSHSSFLDDIEDDGSVINLSGCIRDEIDGGDFSSDDDDSSFISTEDDDDNSDRDREQNDDDGNDNSNNNNNNLGAYENINDENDLRRNVPDMIGRALSQIDPVADQQDNQSDTVNHQSGIITSTAANENNANSINSSSESFLWRIARSEEIPLVRAEIDWKGVVADLLAKKYDGAIVGDETGSLLLQGILRMDPPVPVVRTALLAYPKSCVNMDCFFVACQYCTSTEEENEDTIKVDSNSDNISSYREDEDEEEENKGGVVRLLMRKTIATRERDGIPWSMLAFLGDARIRPHQASLLLRALPQAVADPNHGAFGVSPLDRMISGAFIHGHSVIWVQKLILALSTAEFGSPLPGQRFLANCPTQKIFYTKPSTPTKNSSTNATNNNDLHAHETPSPHHNNFNTWFQSLSASNSKSNASTTKTIEKDDQPPFYPFHSLVKRIASPDFMGVRFGASTFVRTLLACTQSLRHQPPFHQMDNLGRLPIHTILCQEANTNLGVHGERRLIKFLLRACPESAHIPHKGILPLRCAILNGWPCHDIFTDTYIHNNTTSIDLPSIQTIIKEEQTPQKTKESSIHELPIHTILSGSYHRKRFGISGSREIIKFLLQKYPRWASTCNNEGRLPLHLAMENGWPCHDIIAAAAPQSLETRDLKTRFYPFQICASSYDKKMHCLF
jgi:hypothetical protein